MTLSLVTQAHSECLANNSGKHSSIPLSQLGAKAGADYKGDGLAVVPSLKGASLHCVFQRLEAEATREGLWLASSVTKTANDRFRVTATAVGRQSFVRDGVTGLDSETGGTRSTASPSSQITSPGNPWNSSLPATGKVSINGQTVRFIRPGVVEEYSVSMDGVRQDFVLAEKPAGAGQLQVRLTVVGALVEPAVCGAQLVLEHSGRTIAYRRLRATDARGIGLPARMEVLKSNSKSGKQTAEIDQSLLTPPATSFGMPVLVVIIDDSDAVYPVRIDPTFSDANWIGMCGIPGADAAVDVALVDASGNLYIGGEFTAVGNVLANRIAKWNGSTWSALGSGMNDTVQALAVSDGNLYAGGSFTNAGGSTANYIAKWNGSSWSALGLGLDDTVRALAVSGSDLYVGGWFTTAGGSQATKIAKWDGTSWSALGSGLDDAVQALAVLGGDLYAGGWFTTAGGSPADGIAKWDGSNWSAVGLGTDGAVFALAVSGSDLYAGGLFTTAGGNPANYIARWDGNSWLALGSGMDGNVYTLAISGSDLYAGGGFRTAGGSAADRIAKWNGSSWSPLGSGMDGNSPIVYALAVSGGTTYAGGQSTTAGGSAADCIAKWNGSSWSALDGGMDGMNDSVSVLAVSGSDLYAGGWFTTASAVPARYIAKWNGSGWNVLGSGMSGHWVGALAVSGSDLYAGGWFTMAGGSPATNVAKWNGSSWSALGSGMNSYVYALATSGGGLYAGGAFSTAGGTPANNIAKWNGSSWSALGSGLDGYVYGLAVSGNDVYAGGEFTTAGGSPANYVAKWNGSSWSALGSGLDDAVWALAVSGSNIYEGGYFTTAGGTPTKCIAKWNGSSWSALGSGMDAGGLIPRVLALAVSGSDLYAAGVFTTAGGTPANYIAKWNGLRWSTLGSGLDGPASSFPYGRAVVVTGSDLYAGGEFTTAGGRVSAFVAKAIVNPPNLIIKPDTFGGNLISFSGVPGSDYRLQRAPDLKGPWTSSAPQTAPTSGFLEFRDLFPPPGQGFYRAVQP